MNVGELVENYGDGLKMTVEERKSYSEGLRVAHMGQLLFLFVS
jgi:hypothetical protein